MIEIIKDYFPIISACAILGNTGYSAYLGQKFLPISVKKEIDEEIKKINNAIDNFRIESRQFITEHQLEKTTNGLVGILHERMDSFEKQMTLLNTNVKDQLDDLKKMVEKLLDAKINGKN